MFNVSMPVGREISSRVRSRRDEQRAYFDCAAGIDTPYTRLLNETRGNVKKPAKFYHAYRTMHRNIPKA